MTWVVGCATLSLLAWLVFIRPVTPLDLNVFLAGGRSVADGLSPYPQLGSPQVWSGSAFVYPWLTAWLFAPAIAISAHASALVMTAASAVAVATGVWCMTGARVVAFACVLFSAPTIDGLQMGTLNAALFLGLCLAWRWRDRPARVGVTVGVLVTLKILCWPLALWLLVTRRWRATSWAVAAGTISLGIGWILGPLGPMSYGRLLGQLSAHEAGTSSGLQGILVRWSMPIAAAQLIGLACVIALTAMVTRHSDVLIYASMVVAALLASPVVWHHYYLLGAAPLLLAKRGAWWYLLIGWASISARDSYGMSWRIGTTVACIALAIVVAAMIWLRRDVFIASLRHDRYRVLGGSVGLAAIGACLVVAIGLDRFLRGMAPSVISVVACIGMLTVAFHAHRARVPKHRRDLTRPGIEPAVIR